MGERSAKWTANSKQDAAEPTLTVREAADSPAQYGYRSQGTGAPVLSFTARSGSSPVHLVERDAITALTLPTPLTTLVGREQEAVTVSALLRQPEIRLVNLTGPGGVGKTRLAIQVASSMGDAFPEGVAYIPLAATNEPGLVATTIAQAFGLRDTFDRSPVEQLVDYLRPQTLLLVLDNFEHVVPAAPLLTVLLTACPHLKILVTSRTVLGVSGERQFPVQPLALSEPIGVGSVAATTSDAVRLFVERAQAESPDFRLTTENAAAVAAICARLDGLPLAIELAAARVRLLSPEALLVRLERRLPVLTSGRRDAPVRQQTMRNAIAWSHDLLTTDEQRCMQRLAVFVDGFTVEAAEAVVASTIGIGSDDDVFGCITALVDASLLRPVQGSSGASRLAMLETVREFALEQLAASGEEHGVRLAHGDYILDLAERAHDEAHHGSYRSPLTTERANLRAALAWFEEAGETERSLLLVGALWPFWYVHGPYQESRDWVERALARGGDVSPKARGRSLFVCGQLAVMQGDTERAAVCFEESLDGARAGGFTLGATAALLGLVWVAMQQGDFDRAAELGEEALELIWQTDDPRVAEVNGGIILSNLGSIAFARDDLDLASTRFAEALGHQRDVGHRWGEAFSLSGLGCIARARGDEQMAATLFHEALTLFSEHGDRRMIAVALAGAAGLAGSRGQAEQAARLSGAAAALRQTGGLVVDPAYRATYERDQQAMRAALGADGFATAWSVGQAMPFEEALALANALLDSPIVVPEPAPAAARYGLTPREIDVLRLLVDGRADRQIADALSISPHTVMRHVQHILAKLDVDSRTAAATQALRLGIV